MLIVKNPAATPLDPGRPTPSASNHLVPGLCWAMMWVGGGHFQAAQPGSCDSCKSSVVSLHQHSVLMPCGVLAASPRPGTTFLGDPFPGLVAALVSRNDVDLPSTDFSLLL